MKVKRFLALTMASLALAAVLAMPAAAAVQLTVEGAARKSMSYAQSTCNHDPHCVRYGITNCNRQSLHVVFCRIFDERSIAAQGRYACTKLVRVSLDLYSYRAVLTGSGDFSCH